MDIPVYCIRVKTAKLNKKGAAFKLGEKSKMAAKICQQLL